MMRFIKPVSIGEAQLVSSSVPEADYAAWAAGTAYAANAKVVRSHRVFQSVQASNTGHDPLLDLSKVWWVDIGPTNRWAMLDQTVGTLTTADGLIDITLAPGVAVESVALLDVSAASVRVTVTDGGASVFDKTEEAGDQTPLADWYEYFFEEITNAKSALIIEGLPPYPTGNIRIQISGLGPVSCGTVVVGKPVELGRVVRGVKIGITDYSKKTTDDYGVTSVVQRSYARKLDIPVVVDGSRLDYTVEKLSSVRAIPVVWIADERSSSMVIFGYYKDWSVTVEYRSHLDCNLTIEGLV